MEISKMDSFPPGLRMRAISRANLPSCSSLNVFKPKDDTTMSATPSEIEVLKTSSNSKSIETGNRWMASLAWLHMAGEKSTAEIRPLRCSRRTIKGHSSPVPDNKSQTVLFGLIDAPSTHCRRQRTQNPKDEMTFTTPYVADISSKRLFTNSGL